MHAPYPRSAQKLFLENFLVNFFGSTVCKGLLFVGASACYDKAVSDDLDFLIAPNKCWQITRSYLPLNITPQFLKVETKHLKFNQNKMLHVTCHVTHIICPARLSQSIGSCVRFSWLHLTGESRQFIHTVTVEALKLPNNQ